MAAEYDSNTLSRFIINDNHKHSLDHLIYYVVTGEKEYNRLTRSKTLSSSSTCKHWQLIVCFLDIINSKFKESIDLVSILSKGISLNSTHYMYLAYIIRIMYNIIQSQTHTRFYNFFENNLKINFLSPNYYNQKNCKYAYTLEGFDKNWLIASANIYEANYKNLPPGNYTFKIKVSNEDGNWEAKYTSLSIEIKPLFWLTFPAFCLYLIVLYFLIKLNYFVKF